jgi:hypothetical protein
VAFQLDEDALVAVAAVAPLKDWALGRMLVNVDAFATV